MHGLTGNFNIPQKAVLPEFILHVYIIQCDSYLITAKFNWPNKFIDRLEYTIHWTLITNVQINVCKICKITVITGGECLW